MFNIKKIRRDIALIKERKEIMKEKPKLEPIPFGNLSLTLNDMRNLPKFTELLKGDKKD